MFLHSKNIYTIQITEERKNNSNNVADVKAMPVLLQWNCWPYKRDGLFWVGYLSSTCILLSQDICIGTISGYCHSSFEFDLQQSKLLPSLCISPSDVNYLTSLKPLYQFKPKFAWIIFWVSIFNIVSDDPALIIQLSAVAINRLKHIFLPRTNKATFFHWISRNIWIVVPF